MEHPLTADRLATGHSAPRNHRLRAIVISTLCILLSRQCLGAEAPYRTLAAAREGSYRLVETLKQEGPEEALALATRESHQDDPRVQENLARMRTLLPPRMTELGEIEDIEFVGLDRFMSSFGRYNYRVKCANGELRLMFTWRRKTHGWRLNQFYLD